MTLVSIVPAKAAHKRERDFFGILLVVYYLEGGGKVLAKHGSDMLQRAYEDGEITDAQLDEAEAWIKFGDG